MWWRVRAGIAPDHRQPTGSQVSKVIQPLIYRVRRAVARHGLRGTAQRAGRRALRTLVSAESHVWYALDLTCSRPERELAAGVTLRRAGERESRLLDQLPTISPADGAKRIRAGNDLWLALEGDRPLFSCWIFREQTPVLAAPGGQLRLPEGTVCLEDSVTSAAARGRGIAPAAWASIADSLADEGQNLMITKITVENTPSRRAVEKAGFTSVALMHFRRLGPMRRTSIELLDADRGRFFADSLGG